VHLLANNAGVSPLGNIWENSTADFEGTYYPSFEQIRVLPPPAHRIPIWIGGGAEAALERALRNDGYHALGPSPEEMKVLGARLREQRPDADFTISVRVGWDVTTRTGEMVTAAPSVRPASTTCSRPAATLRPGWRARRCQALIG
jgi:alkanesulfonate monooxygenase SsuD/methylene tetrahydromethanopterin reductase-like flavin-dependent oxidoreductase (luciferase family)